MPNLGFPIHLESLGHDLPKFRNAFWNLTTPELIDQIEMREEGKVSNIGCAFVESGKHTGRSPLDKYIVQYPEQKDQNICWGKINQPLSPAQFDKLHQKANLYFQERDAFIQDLFVGAHPEHQMPLRIITDTAWQSLVSRHLFVRPQDKFQANQQPTFTVLCGINLYAEPNKDGTHSETFIAIDFVQRLVLIGGTGYAGEIKKAIFTIMHYLMPRQNILSMHCSANIGSGNDVALFFGLSGTGKTTLSSDTQRKLIGDDEHGWMDTGIFNFEGGCYAKTINLSETLEPLIWRAVNHYGTVLENVIYNSSTDKPDFTDNRITDNTRASYPLEYISNRIKGDTARHPKNIFFLAADAFGVLPPISRLTSEQAMYYFLSGYTSKLAGTEDGLGKEPQATFSTCFAAPFLPLHPEVYARLLGEKVRKHNAFVWLVNTGWTGGPYGTGQRIPLPFTRAMIQAVLKHSLQNIPFHRDNPFGLWVPDSCPGVPDNLLIPQLTWEDPIAYNQKAIHLINLFEENFKSFEFSFPCKAGWRYQN